MPKCVNSRLVHKNSQFLLKTDPVLNKRYFFSLSFPSIRVSMVPASAHELSHKVNLSLLFQAMSFIPPPLRECSAAFIKLCVRSQVYFFRSSNLVLDSKITIHKDLLCVAPSYHYYFRSSSSCVIHHAAVDQCDAVAICHRARVYLLFVEHNKPHSCGIKPIIFSNPVCSKLILPWNQGSFYLFSHHPFEYNIPCHATTSFFWCMNRRLL